MEEEEGAEAELERAVGGGGLRSRRRKGEEGEEGDVEAAEVEGLRWDKERETDSGEEVITREGLL